MSSYSVFQYHRYVQKGLYLQLVVCIKDYQLHSFHATLFGYCQSFSGIFFGCPQSFSKTFLDCLSTNLSVPHSRVLYYQSFNVTFLDCLTSIFHSSRRHQFFCLSVGLICNAPITLPTYCGILDSHMTSNCCLLRVLINIRLRVPLAAELSMHRCLAVVKANRVVLPTKL